MKYGRHAAGVNKGRSNGEEIRIPGGRPCGALVGLPKDLGVILNNMQGRVSTKERPDLTWVFTRLLAAVLRMQVGKDGS